MWSINLSSNRYDGILLEFWQYSYDDIRVKVYRSTTNASPVEIAEISYTTGWNQYLDESCEAGISYCYWLKSVNTLEMSDAKCGGIKLGEDSSVSVPDSFSYSSLSTSSCSSLSTSSSSFGDATDLLYFVDKLGDLYILRGDEHSVKSSLVFRSFSSIANAPMGLAISYFSMDESSSSTEILSSSSSSFSSVSSTTGTSSSSSPKQSSSSSTSESSSSPSSSRSSESTENYDYNVYILRKKNNTTANMAIHDMTGYLKGSIDFVSAVNFLGMSVWPGNNNLIVAISENTIYMLYLSSGQIGVYSFESPVALTYGIACKDLVDENSAEFFVRRKDQKELVLIKINKKDKSCSIVNPFACPLSKWQRLGGIACDLSAYGLIGEMKTIYNIIEESKGYSHLFKTIILTGMPTLFFISVVPFSVYGCCVPVIGSTSTSLIEPEKLPTLAFRRYDIEGNFIENFNSLFMGIFQPGVKSAISIVNILAEGLTSMSNLKIAIVENGISGAEVNNTVLYGVSETIDPSFVPTKYFPGLNTTNTSEDVSNVEIGMKVGGKSIESKYLYLQLNVPPKFIGRGYLVFKLFFDYE